jgi:glucose/arabinose dehydrogenase
MALFLFYKFKLMFMEATKMKLFKKLSSDKWRWTGLWLIVLSCMLLLFQRCNKLVDIIDPDHGNHGSGAKKLDLKFVADLFVSPIGLVAVPDGSKRLFVIDQIGKIWIIDAKGNKLSTPFLDLSSKLVTLSPGFDERGLLGLAFHPDYKNNGRFFVYYQMPPRSGGPQAGVSWNNFSRIVEFKVSSGNPNLADMSSEKPIIELDDPQSNNNSGTLAFGPDGYLYISIGDGGAANDVAPGHVDDWYAVNAGGNGQDVEANLFGNILRINVNSGSPYSIPPDNPFVGKPGRDEIFAYGFRNPFRFSFDMGGSHRLFAGDAGQVLYEEINVVKKGGNYGWNVKEGTHCFNAANNKEELSTCPDVDNLGNPLIDPVIELNNWQNPKGGKATVVIGGNVYRGQSIPDLEGKYIFGTFSQTSTTPNGELFMANPEGPGLWPYEEISLKGSPNDVGYFLKGFGQDQDGEIYLTVSSQSGPSGSTGKVFKLVEAK